MPRTRSLLVCVLTASCLLGVVASAQACTTWKGGSGDWDEASHWTPDVTVSSGGTTISTATAHWQKATKGKRK